MNLRQPAVEGVLQSMICQVVCHWLSLSTIILALCISKLCAKYLYLPSVEGADSTASLVSVSRVGDEGSQAAKSLGGK